MTSPSIPLGPFDVLDRIGGGGMGAIWRGVHRRQQVPVAFKVITAAEARSPSYLDGFRREVQAMARLSHRHIVLVLDYGVVPEAAAVASAGALVAGSPYLAMEYAQRGALDRLRFPLSWGAVRPILLSLLEALGHAHARGVIHRDLKPGNVLLVGDTGRPPALKLTDFGIAHAADRHADWLELTAATRERPVGTPQYMAPEQFEGRWRDYGPWTDLYALGIMAYELVTGRLPFQADSMIRLAFMHLREELPALGVARAVPRGFEAWLRRLTAKDPRLRFQLARDAAWSLARLDTVVAPSDRSDAFEPEPRSADDDLELAATLSAADLPGLPPPTGRGAAEEPDPTLRESLHATLEDVPAAPSGVDSGPPAPAGRTGRPPSDPPSPCSSPDLPPLPDTWSTTQPEPATSFRLMGAGIGLWGLRAFPVVDRQRERDLLWAALREVREARMPWVVVLEGSAGVGKSRLAEWLCERAHEAGNGILFRAIHEPTGGPGHGLRSMIAEHLRCLGLPRGKVESRLEGLLRARGCTDEYEWQALTELIYADDGGRGEAGRTVRFSNAAQRYHLVHRLLARLGEERPIVVWLDDVQWGSDALSFVAHVMDAHRDRPAPVLFLLTVRQEVLEERALERDQVRELLALQRSTFLNIPPLPEVDSGLLINELLGLSGELAEQVKLRAAGNPLFAVQLVGHWVERGVLEVGDEGFVLRAGAKAELPDNIHQLWSRRLRPQLAGFGEQAAIALELAAALGQAITRGELEAACHQRGIDYPADLFELLLARRLAVRSANGWAFAHPMLRESLERTSREKGRWVELNRVCQEMLRRRYGEGAPGLAARRARHLLEGEDYAQAIVLLKSAIREHLAVSEYAEAERLIEAWERAVAALDLPPSDPRRGEGWVLQADARRLQWKFTEAAELTDRVLFHATLYGWQAIHGEALLLMANIARQQGVMERAEQIGQQALTRFQRQGDRIHTARALLALAATCRVQGDHLRAIGYYEQALASFEDLNEDDGVAKCLLGLGHVHRAQKHLKRASSLYAQAKAICERIGNRHEVASCINGLAELARYAGDLAAAEAGYRQALTIQTAIGSEEVSVTETNLAALEIRNGAYLDAMQRLSRLAEGMERTGQRAFLPYVYVFMLACTAGLGDLPTYRTIHPLAVKLIAETSTVDVDLAEYAELAGDLLSRARRGRPARHAYEIALAQYRALGNEVAVARLSRAIEPHASEPRS